MRRVLIVSHAVLLVAGIKRLLQKEPDMEVYVAAPADEATLLLKINQCQPHVIILDAGAQIIGPDRLLFC